MSTEAPVAFEKTKEVVKRGWCKELLSPEGIVGDIQKWIVHSSGMYQPRFALAAALTVGGALLGRSVKDRTGKRPNIYTLSLGRTSMGKNAPLQLIPKLVNAVGMEILTSGEASSDSALESLIDFYPTRILLLDEVGHYLVSLKQAGPSNPHLKTVVPMLTKLWSAAEGVHIGKVRAPDSNGKLRLPKRIKNPFCAVYGTSEPDIVFDNMQISDLKDGSFPRFVCFLSDTRPDFMTKDEPVVPSDLQRKIINVLDRFGVKRVTDGDLTKDGKLHAEIIDAPTTTVGETEEAELVFDELEDEKRDALYIADEKENADDQIFYAYGKIVEQARRIALIVACLRDHPGQNGIVIEEYDARYACDLMRLTTYEVVNRLKESICLNPRHGMMRDVLRAIRRGDDNREDRLVTQSVLTSRTQSIERRTRCELIADLCEMGCIRQNPVAGTGRKPVMAYEFIRGL